MDFEPAHDKLRQWILQGHPFSASCYSGNQLYIRLSSTINATRSAHASIGGELQSNNLWTSLRHQTHEFFRQHQNLWRVSVPPSAETIASGQAQLTEWNGALHWIASDTELFTKAREAGGHATQYRLFGEISDNPFQPLSSTMLALHQRLKKSFDPENILNPGRLYQSRQVVSGALMRTSISSNYLNKSTGAEAERILRNCVHCGFCNATCPTYLLLGDELDGPRGRIYLIKNMLEGETPTAKTQLHLDRCLTCRSCETTCPSGVEYGRLLDIGRELVADQVKRSPGQRLFRFSLRKFLLNTKLFAGSLRIAQAFKSILPRRFQQNIPLRTRSTLVWPVTPHQRKIILVEGCVQTALQPDIDKAAAIVFDKVGIQSLRIKAAGCCGSISHHADARKETLAYIKTNIDAPVYAARAEKVSALYRDPGEILAKENIKTTATDKRIAFHPPCTLQHGLKLDGVIETLLSSMGFELVAFRDKHLCCGSAGTYSITQKQLSTRLLENKLSAIETNAPDLIVTANIGCQTHLQSGTNTPVRHWLELLV